MAALEEILQRHPVWLGRAPQLAAPAVPTGFQALDSRTARRRLAARGADRDPGQPGRHRRAGAAPAGAGGPDLGRQAGGMAGAAPSALCPGARRGGDQPGAARRGARPRPARCAVGGRAGAARRHAATRCSAGSAARATTTCGALRSRQREAAPWSRCSARAKPPRESSPACLRLALEPDGDAPEGNMLSVHILKRRGMPAAAPLRLAVKRPVHALARSPFSLPAAGRARADRGLGLPVHA